MLLSIIIPCYNYDHNLEKLCASLVEEFPHDSEIILVNDGSTDKTKTICDSIARDYPTVKVFHQENKGPAAARQLGTDKASGRWIYYIDADDQIIHGAGAKILQTLSSDPQEEILIGGFISVTPAGKSKEKIPNCSYSSHSEWVKAFLHKKISIVNGGILLKRSIFKTIKWDCRFKIAEDKIFYTHCLAKFNVRTLNFAMCTIIHHNESLRNSADKAVKEIPHFIETLFEVGKLPQDIYKLKKAFHAKRHLSASRIYFLTNDNQRGREEFYKAFKVSPLSVLNKSYLKKLLLSFIK